MSEVVPAPLRLTIPVEERAVLAQAPSLSALFAQGGPGFAAIAPGWKKPLAAAFPDFRWSVGGPKAFELWATQDVEQKPLDAYIVEDAFYFPGYGAVVLPDGGALAHSIDEAIGFSRDLSALPWMRATDGGTVFAPPADSPYLPKAAVTLPWGALHNYGHFLLDCLSGVALLRDAARRHHFPFVTPPLQPWQADHFALFGITPTILGEPVYRIGRLAFSSCMAHYLHRPSAQVRDIAALQRRPRALAKRRKLYLSRRGNAKRKFLSEDRLETALAARGFDIVQPERPPVPEQIALFAAADVIAGNTGAAFANIIYCRPDTLIVEVQPEGMHNLWVRNIAALHGLRWSAYFCDSTVLLPGHPEAGMQFDFDVDDFLSFIAQHDDHPATPPHRPWWHGIARALGR